MWYLIVLIPDLCHLSYFNDFTGEKNILALLGGFKREFVKFEIAIVD